MAAPPGQLVAPKGALSWQIYDAQSKVVHIKQSKVAEQKLTIMPT